MNQIQPLYITITAKRPTRTAHYMVRTMRSGTLPLKASFSTRGVISRARYVVRWMDDGRLKIIVK